MIVAGCDAQRSVDSYGRIKPTEEYRPWNYKKHDDLAYAFDLIKNSLASNHELLNVFLGLGNAQTTDRALYEVSYLLSCNSFRSAAINGCLKMVPVVNYFSPSVDATITRSSTYLVLFLFMISHSFDLAFLPSGHLHMGSLYAWLDNVFASTQNEDNDSLLRKEARINQLKAAIKRYASECTLDQFESNKAQAVIKFGYPADYPFTSPKHVFTKLSTNAPSYPTRVILNLLEMPDPTDIVLLNMKLKTVFDWLQQVNQSISPAEKLKIEALLKEKEEDLKERMTFLQASYEAHAKSCQEAQEHLLAIQKSTSIASS